jgi:hypothetical protein
MLQTMRMLTLTLGMGLVLCVLLAPTGRAAPKTPTGTDTVTCSLSQGTNFTWQSGTTLITYVFARSDSSVTAQGSITVHGNKAGSTNISTPGDAATVQATFFKKSIGGRQQPVICTP